MRKACFSINEICDSTRNSTIRRQENIKIFRDKAIITANVYVVICYLFAILLSVSINV